MSTRKIVSFLKTATIALALAGSLREAAPADAPVASRETKMRADVDALLAKMTLEEKIGQLNLLTSRLEFTGPSAAADDAEMMESLAAGRAGAVFNAYTAAYARRLQKVAVEGTRLHIPLLFGYDVIHGYRTIFPIPLGEAATWDVEAVELSARVAAREASAEGVNWTFAPMVDIARDPRWGRIAEGSGEDVFLGSALARARVRGFQGDDLARPDTVLATAKHFAAYGAAQAGRDYHTADISERTLRDIYLPPFKAALDEGALSVMTAFNEVDGVPATGSKFLLSTILRGEWGFEGLIVSDYGSINLMIPHGVAQDPADAGEKAIEAGVDLDMESKIYATHLKRLVEAGEVDASTIDRAARRVLEMKHRLGLFDDPYRYIDESREASMRRRPEHLAAARDVARKSIVLLKNEREVLPLPSSVRRIALIGPLGDSKKDMLGPWAGAGDRKSEPVTLREGLEARFADKVDIRVARGASYEFKDVDDRSGFEEALRIAQGSDVIIAAMGESAEMSGEAASRALIDLPGSQQALLDALAETGKPIVLVLMNGRPLELTAAAARVDAIVEAWFPGTMGGHAIADVLSGDYNPSGKLPATFPRAVGQVPIHYDMKNTGQPFRPDEPDAKYVSRYLDVPNTPLFPFGFGLSYSEFEISPIALKRSRIRPGETLQASVTVSNRSRRRGTETVQIYVRDLVGSVTRPVKELKEFRKVTLDGGKSARVTFELRAEDLAFTRADMSWGAEPGEFTLYVGKSSADVVEAGFELTE